MKNVFILMVLFLSIGCTTEIVKPKETHKTISGYFNDYGEVSWFISIPENTKSSGIVWVQIGNRFGWFDAQKFEKVSLYLDDENNYMVVSDPLGKLANYKYKFEVFF